MSDVIDDLNNIQTTKTIKQLTFMDNTTNINNQFISSVCFDENDNIYIAMFPYIFKILNSELLIGIITPIIIYKSTKLKSSPANYSLSTSGNYWGFDLTPTLDISQLFFKSIKIKYFNNVLYIFENSYTSVSTDWKIWFL